jgi:hypothetical protein
MMLLLSTLIACQVMDNPGHVFSSVAIAEEAEHSTTHKPEEATDEDSKDSTEQGDSKKETIDPLFVDPQEDVIQMGVDKPAEIVEPESAPIEATDKPDVATDAAEEQDAIVDTPSASPTQQPASTWKPATVKDGWRPTLIGTLMDGPTPRAILAMPSGEEKVIKAGDMLAEDGVVVMAIGESFVELAVVNSSEGRAQIQNLTLSTQF